MAGRDRFTSSGSVIRALAPQVYALVKAGDLTNSGAIAGRELVSLSVDNLANLGGRIQAEQIGIAAQTDLNNIGGTITAGSALLVSAGRDINLVSTTTASSNANGSRSSIDRLSSLSVTGTALNGGTLIASAGRDLNLAAGVINNDGVGGISSLSAMNSLNLNSVKVGDSNHIVWDASNRRDDASSSDIGSQITAAGNVQLNAGLNLSATALTLQAAQNVLITAGNNLTLNAGAATSSVDEEHTHTSNSGFLSKTTTTTLTKVSQSTAVGSTIEGAAVTLKAQNDLAVNGSQVSAKQTLVVDAGRDLTVDSVQESATSQRTLEQKKSGFVGFAKSTTQQDGTQHSTTQAASVLSAGSVTAVSGRDLDVKGSTVVADNAIEMTAARNLTINSAQNTSSKETSSSSQKSGFIGSFLQPAIGREASSETGQSESVTQAGSQVASLKGDVNVSAGARYTQTASQVLALAAATDSTAAGNIAIQAQTVEIDAANDTSRSQDKTAYSKVALGVSVSVPIVEAVKSMASVAGAAGKTSDPRMQALAAATLALKSQELGSVLAAPTAGVKVSVSLGSSKSESETLQMRSNVVGSEVSAAGNVTLRATGAASASTLDVIGSEIKGGGDVSLIADGAINLKAASNASTQASSNSNSGMNIGVGYLNGAQNGYTLDFGASKGLGKADGTDLYNTNAYVTAGKTASLKSAGDTNLIGAVLAANTVKVDAGGDLNIASLQDSSQYGSKNISAGFGVSLCLPPACYGSSTASGSVSKAKATGDYVSVTEQSGIKAGDGGFQVGVKGNTDLKGGVLASSDKAVLDNRNSLVTGTLTSSDLQNKDHSEASGFSLSGSVSGKMGEQSKATSAEDKNAADDKQNPSKPGGSAGAGSISGSQDNTTLAGISGAAITLSDGVKQQALTGTSVQQTIASLNRDVNSDSTTGLKKAWDGKQMEQEVQAQTHITEAFGQAAAKKIGDYADQQRAEALKNGDPVEAANWDEGGAYRVAAHVAAGALGGGVAGALGASASATLMPIIGNQIDAMDLPEPVKQALGAAAAAAIGSVAGGTVGAATGFNIDVNNRQLDPKETKYIDSKAKAYAKERGISVDQATKELSRGALYGNDADWQTAYNTYTPEDVAAYKAAAIYLQVQAKIDGVTITNLEGQQQAAFTATPSQFANEKYLLKQAFSDPKTLALYADKATISMQELGAMGGLRFDANAVIGFGVGVPQGMVDGLKAYASLLDSATYAKLLDAAKIMAADFDGTMKKLASGVAGQAQESAFSIYLNLMQKDSKDLGETAGKLTGGLIADMAASAVGIKLAGVAVSTAEDVSVLVAKKISVQIDKMATDALLKSGGAIDITTGLSFLDLKKLSTAQKGIMGELIGEGTVKQIIPDGIKLARFPGVGETGLDDLYKVNRPGVDYVVIEYKFVGTDAKTGASALGKTTDGLQASESWITGSGRIEKAVGADAATDVYRSVRSGRTETWVVTTRPDGSTSLEVLDALGERKPIDTSKIILSKTNLSGAHP